MVSHPSKPHAFKRVGHKGADTIAPGNTLESFDAALEMGVDMIEFDVLPLPDGRLVLAHDYEDVARRDPPSLEEGLDHFAGDAYAGVEIDVDMKLPGYEREVVEGLVSRGLGPRALVSSAFPQSLDRIADLGAGVRRGFSIPRARRDYTQSHLAPVAYAVMAYWRIALPRRIERFVAAGRCEAVMAHQLLVTGRLVRAVKRAGGNVYVWTVDDRTAIARLAALGVDGVITNDPRLFRADPRLAET